MFEGGLLLCEFGELTLKLALKIFQQLAHWAVAPSEGEGAQCFVG